MSEHTPPAERPPLAKRPVFWLILVAVLLLVVASVFAGMAIGSGIGTSEGAAASGSARPTPSATTTPPADTAPADPTTPPAAGGVTIPADCTAIYTRDWASELAPLTLNPAWTDAADSGVRWATDDVNLQTMLDGTTRLTCIWANPAGGGDVGITTNVAVLTEVQQPDVVAQFESLGYDCFDELEGLRCIDQHEEEAGAWGESHFLREGVWIATGWVNAGPNGYTHDIVTTIFG
jgi:hypothetical protein